MIRIWFKPRRFPRDNLGRQYSFPYYVHIYTHSEIIDYLDIMIHFDTVIGNIVK